jgi:hypothetical protein
MLSYKWAGAHPSRSPSELGGDPLAFPKEGKKEKSKTEKEKRK